jgi:hypothetical protein
LAATKASYDGPEPDANPLAFPQTAKIGSLADVQASDDPEGMRVFYYLVQDLKVSPTLPSPSFNADNSG